jgi:N-acyl-D-aspartate/D-glutamate deacylase
MAHYNFPLRFLRMVNDAAAGGTPIMSLEKAVWRVTGELASWFGLDAGVLAPGKRADLVVLDPKHLDGTVDQASEAAIPEMGGLVRLVRRNDALVKAVVVNGKLVSEHGKMEAEVGRARGYGQVLRAG